jgi:hypothetical protein
VAADEFRLVVPGVDLARSAVHEQPDDGFGAAAEGGRFGVERVGGAEGGRHEQAGVVQQAGEAEQAGALAGAAQPFAAVEGVMDQST